MTLPSRPGGLRSLSFLSVCFSYFHVGLFVCVCLLVCFSADRNKRGNHRNERKQAKQRHAATQRQPATLCLPRCYFHRRGNPHERIRLGQDITQICLETTMVPLKAPFSASRGSNSAMGMWVVVTSISSNLIVQPFSPL